MRFIVERKNLVEN